MITLGAIILTLLMDLYHDTKKTFVFLIWGASPPSPHLFKIKIQISDVLGSTLAF